MKIEIKGHNESFNDDISLELIKGNIHISQGRDLIWWPKENIDELISALQQLSK